MPIDYAGAVSRIFASDKHQPLTGLYEQGSNSKSLAGMFRPELQVDDPLAALHGDELLINVPSTEFAAGFTSPAAITPRTGDKFTPTGTRQATVTQARRIGGGAYWVLTLRRRQSGT